MNVDNNSQLSPQLHLFIIRLFISYSQDVSNNICIDFVTYFFVFVDVINFQI